MCIDAISYLLGKKKGGGGETPTLINKNITANGTYNASSDEADGYKKVIVDVPSSGGRDWSAIGYSSEPQSISDGYNYAKQIYDNWDSSNTNMTQMFTSDNQLVFMPLVDTSNITKMNFAFNNCYYLINIPSLNTSNVQEAPAIFDDCTGLKSLPMLDFSNMVRLSNISFNIPNLVNLGGFKDLGKAYLTTAQENYSRYTLTLYNCVNLTHDSLMNVINNLYDIKSKGCNNQSLALGSTNLAKLTEEEIAIATNKGWNVS